MKWKFLTMISLVAGCAHAALAQNEDKAQAYILKYKDIAVQEQIRTGIPAAIKLAQGLFESASGKSELAQNANNHFGIKCKATWTGSTYTYSDDRKDECFRKYENDIASFQDHSDFLAKNPRYATLFTYTVDDYENWAHGLKRAGYATNPLYAKKIIELIERYELNQYTHLAKNSANTKVEPIYAQLDKNTQNTTVDVPVQYVAASAPKVEVVRSVQLANSEQPATQKDYYVTTKLNNLKGFWVPKGAMLLDYAIKNKVRYARILEYNELPDAPLEADMFVYLEKKHLKSADDATTIVAETETLLQVSQRTGVQVSQIRLLNKLVAGVEPKPGSVLHLQEAAATAPEVYIPSPFSTPKNNVAQVATKANEDAYIVKNKTNNNNTATTINEPKIVGTKAQEEALQDKVVYKAQTEEKNVQPTNSKAQATTASTTKSNDDKNLSPYERLKKHMDQQVNNKESYYESNQPATVAPANNVEEEYVTTAARGSNSVYQDLRNNKSNVATTTPKKTTTPAATTTKKTVAPKYHTVKKGETLTAIAGKYKVSVKELQSWNKVTPKTLKAGQKLKVSK